MLLLCKKKSRECVWIEIQNGWISNVWNILLVMFMKQPRTYRNVRARIEKAKRKKAKWQALRREKRHKNSLRSDFIYLFISLVLVAQHFFFIRFFAYTNLLLFECVKLRKNWIKNERERKKSTRSKLFLWPESMKPRVHIFKFNLKFQWRV